VAVLVLATLLLYAAFDEQTQKLVNRSCEMADWNADAAGTSIAVVGAYAIARWSEKREAQSVKRKA
jgi:VanZ family protein